MSSPIFQATVSGQTASGEVAGATSATQMPDIKAGYVKLKAAHDNAGKVYVGFTSGVTKADGSTDVTTGWPLAAGESEQYFITNVNQLYYICDNAGDDLIYQAYIV